MGHTHPWTDDHRLIPGSHETLPFEPAVACLAEELGVALGYRACELAATAEVDQPAFQGLSEADWKTFLDHTTAIYFRPGDVLIHQGDMARSLYIVAEGQLEVVLSMANGASAFAGCQRKLGHWRSRLPGCPTAYSVGYSAYRRLYLQANNGRLCTTQTDGASLSHRCAVRHCAGGVATLPYPGESALTPAGDEDLVVFQMCTLSLDRLY